MTEKKYAYIQPLTGKKIVKTVNHIISVDCEDDTRGNLVVACVYGDYLKRFHNGKKVVHVEETFYKRKDLVRFLSGLKSDKQDFEPCTLVGFNIAYDMAYFDEIINYETVIFAGTRFIVGELTNTVKIMDIFNHCGGKSLDDWITELKLNDMGIFKTEWRKDMTIEELTNHCQNDVRAHWEVAEFFRRTYEDIGVAFKYTTSSTALNLFQRRFFKSYWKRDVSKYNQLEREAYSGGRTEIFTRGIHRIKSYDINSAYVSVMADEYYPDPTTAKHHKGDKRFKIYYRDRQNLMIVHCKVFAPKNRVMVLPYNERNEKGEKVGKLIFPHGTFEGHWCSPELHKAEEYGYKILKVYDYITYSRKDKCFEDYANFTWEQRHLAAARGDDGMKTVWKLFGNGLYGKLAQRNPKGGHFLPVVPVLTGSHVRPIVHTTIDGTDWYVVQASGTEESINSFPCVSAFITCYTRLKLLEYLKRHEKTVIYCDTDSIKIPWDDTPEAASNELGGVKLECSDDPEKNQCGWYCFLKPKLYGRIPKSFVDLPPNYDFITPIKGLSPRIMSTDTDKWKIKGVGRYDFGYFDLEDMVFRATFRKPNRFKESVRRGLTQNEWITMGKELTILDDKRTWKGQNSEPLKI